MTLLNARRFAEAIAPLEQLTRDDPQNAHAWYLLGAALHFDGQIERALPVHGRAASFPEVRANALYNQGCAFARTGQVDAAFTSLAEALAAPGGGALRGNLVADTDLATLRSDPRWSALTADAPPAARIFVEEVDVLHVWQGETAGEQFGWEAVDAGDVDGDGAHDVLASAPFHRAPAAPAAMSEPAIRDSNEVATAPPPAAGPNGRVVVYSGRSGALLWQRVGEPGENLGLGISAAGDVNGDGTPDVIVGAPSPVPVGVADAPLGRALVLSGRDGALLLDLRGEQAGDRFGDQVRGLGDVDGDGHADVAVSAPFHDVAVKAGAARAEAGRVRVFSGASGAPLFALDGERAGDHFGSALGGATWAAADGARAGLLVIGAMDAGEGSRGRIFVHRLRGGRPQPFFSIDAEPTGRNLGQFFASVVGDLDGDGVPDIYATDFADSTQPDGAAAAGRVYLHSGADGKRLAQLAGRTPDEGFGIGNAQAGDVNGDGFADLVIGAWTHAAGAPRGGKVYVLSGKDHATLAEFTGTRPGDEFGFDATGLGDVNGDGATDFLITAASAGDLAPRAGRVYVISGAGIARPSAAR